jgi:hypothetical protein
MDGFIKYSSVDVGEIGSTLITDYVSIKNVTSFDVGDFGISECMFS